MRPIGELNQLSQEEFALALRPLFEAAHPLARALYAERPFASYEDLLARAERIAARLPLHEQIAVLNAHPRIGEKPEVVSAMSYREQGYAAEAALPPDRVRQVYAELAALNQAYEERFGFRFVVFVDRRPKAEIVEVLRRRLHNTRDEELRAGLRDVFLIARDRSFSTSS